MSWQDTLLDASYKGVPFEATEDALRGVHALAEHSYPFVDGSDIEDTGCEALTMDITAVLYGDDYEGRLQKLIKVLREGGGGELVHPIYGSVPDCVVADFEVGHHEDSPDYATIRISFRQSVAAAPFFAQELPLAMADEIDHFADLAAWQGFEVFSKALAGIRGQQRRWNAFHAAALTAVGVLYGQINGVFSGSLDLINSPRVLMTELLSVFGGLAGLYRRGGKTLDGWRDLAGATRRAADVPRQVHSSLIDAGNRAPIDHQGARVEDVAVLCGLIATVGAANLASEAADLLALELEQPVLTPREVSQVLADSREALMRSLTAQRICGMMLANPDKAAEMAGHLLDLYQEPAQPAEGVYQRFEAAGLLPARPYLEHTAELAQSVRRTAHTLQKQALAVINLRPPLVQKVAHADTSLHLLAFAWYGDYRRQAELVRLNPHIRHPNFVPRGSLIHAYAR